MTVDTDRALLDFHRELVETPSVSGDEATLADAVERRLRGDAWRVERVGNSVIAIAGESNRPVLLLDSHLDTVPPADGWSADPHVLRNEDGRLIGLGANDAKASVAALTAAFCRTVSAASLPFTLVLALVEAEETRGIGTENTLRWLAEHDLAPTAAVVGEPTGLDVAIAQKGLMILRLIAAGDACHAANAGALGARNANRALARAIVALDDIDLGPADPALGPTTLEPTRMRAGDAKNALPGFAEATLDVRSVPGVDHDELIARIEARLANVPDVSLDVVSKRLEPRRTDESTAIVRAALRARPSARAFGSRTMSDMVFVKDCPVIKVGPGESARSHTADEFVHEHELLAGADFYEKLIHAFAAASAAEGSPA